MKRTIRLAGFSLVLLLLLVAGVACTSLWLRRQNDRMLAEIVQTRRTQCEEILALAQAGPPPWSAAFTNQLGRALDAVVTVRTAETPHRAPTEGRARSWRFEQVVRDATGTPLAVVEVRLTPPPTVRSLELLHRIGAILLSLALLLVITVPLLVLTERRWFAGEDPGAGSGRSGPVEDYGVLSRLAEQSARQSAELEQERAVRQRAETDSHLKQVLLNRALQEKIEMGRDLHDGLIQSLYATGLTIQAGRKALEHDPALAREQFDNALQTLNAAIREVRTYIAGLGPEKLRQTSFAESVRAIIEHLAAGRPITTELRIDEDAAKQLSAEQDTELLQIVREAVSNSLRHGQAGHLAVRLHRNGDELGLLVQDDGRGFDPAAGVRGHGLDNMQARAERLGAQFRCQSDPGHGARVILHFPISTRA